MHAKRYNIIFVFSQVAMLTDRDLFNSVSRTHNYYSIGIVKLPEQIVECFLIVHFAPLPRLPCRSIADLHL
jgi:hypothetical protein